MKKKRIKQEKILNVPNPLSLSRIIISPFLVYFVFTKEPLWLIAIVFAIAAFTDFLDGFIARKFKQETSFGRRLDMIADRVLMMSLVLALFSYMYLNGLLTKTNIILIILLTFREIFCAPFFIIALIRNSRPMPHARFAGKLTTTLQGIGFPIVILGWSIAIYFAIATAIAGLVCTGYYIYDSLINPNNEFQKRMDKHYENL